MFANVRTEYSFRHNYGQVTKVVKRLKEIGATAACIADLSSTWGHVAWKKACEQYGIKPLFGVVLPIVEDIEYKDRKQPFNNMTFIALTTEGLKQIYEAVKVAHDNFYWRPRLAVDYVNGLSKDDVAVVGGLNPSSLLTRHYYNQLSPDAFWLKGNQGDALCCLDNYYPKPDDDDVYQLLMDERTRNTKTTEQYIITIDEWKRIFPDNHYAIEQTQALFESADVVLEKAPMLRFSQLKGRQHQDIRFLEPEIEAIEKAAGCKLAIVDVGLHQSATEIVLNCVKTAPMRGITLVEEVYAARFIREMNLIIEKDYADYFLVVADLIQYAKKHMLVGPSRGSSAGSIVCFLMYITEIDPIPHGLLFERFIDINRADLPDIDIDFPDNKRNMVVKYLERTYGKDCVCHIGNVNKLKPKSAITTFAKSLNIPAYETNDVKDAIIERSGGDARAAMCIKDTLETTEVGKAFVHKYPVMGKVEEIEGHASHSGIHAAGIVVCNNPITNYAGVNSKDDIVAMIDKYDAEYLNLLKIDVLGLRNLTILEQTCDMIGMVYDDLYKIPLDDEKTFAIFNEQRFTGVFQFEGYALQALTKQMGVNHFNDIVAITSLARPGPLHSGGASMFVERRTGRAEIEYLSQHPAVIKHTKETLGIIIYQEQLMSIGKDYGDLSWDDVSDLRKAASKSLGEEFFNKYRGNFLRGTRAQGIDDKEAIAVWENMVTFGSWGFNKSHAVSYGLISYWTAWMKAHHPMEFAVASLNNVRDDDSGVKLLRDMVKNEGYEYIPLDINHSTEKWSIYNNKLLGGLTNVKGIGDKVAKKIIDLRYEGKDFPDGIRKKLTKAETAYDILFPADYYFGDYYSNPAKYNIVSGSVNIIRDIQETGTYIFIGRLVDRNLRDLNEYQSIVKRGGKIIKEHTLFLNFTVEDDTDSIICTIDRYNYDKFGKPIAETGKVGEDWYLIKGNIKDNWRRINVTNIRKLCTKKA